MEDNIEYARRRLKDLHTHIFLTGDAGTGKTTLSREFIKEHEGECIVCASTGIAAQVLGGVTIHSFFHFPARPINYQAVKKLDPFNPADAEKFEIILRAKYLMIDEASMVRPDLMDQIAWFFRKNFPNHPPFAGLKVIMIGDLDQLPPVVKDGPEKDMIEARYSTPFFFSADCWNPERHASFEIVKLTKVWRQSDPFFIDFLNSIKRNNVNPITMAQINSNRLRTTGLSASDGIVVCSTNKDADHLNQYMMERLEGKDVTLNGIIKGNFNTKDCNVASVITLKPDCRVMIMRNGAGYNNGSLGTFKRMNYDDMGDDIHGYPGDLEIELDNGETVLVPPFTFETVDYAYDKKKDRITHQVVGSMIQFPVRIGYAITVHKSQGQSFDKCIIDLGERGAFAHGQLYVALSRCRSLEGLILRRPITEKDLIFDQRILAFNKRMAV